MAISTGRGAFVTNEYRYTPLSDSAVQLQQPSAGDEEILTNLSPAGCDALAAELFNELKQTSKCFDVIVDGVTCAAPGSFDGSPPTFQSIFQDFTDATGRKQRPMAVTISRNSGRTTAMRLRG